MGKGKVKSIKWVLNVSPKSWCWLSTNIQCAVFLVGIAPDFAWSLPLPQLTQWVLCYFQLNPRINSSQHDFYSLLPGISVGLNLPSLVTKELWQELQKDFGKGPYPWKKPPWRHGLLPLVWLSLWVKKETAVNLSQGRLKQLETNMKVGRIGGLDTRSFESEDLAVLGVFFSVKYWIPFYFQLLSVNFVSVSYS